MDSITPGATISMRITKNPTTAAARKTLIRLARKDPAMARHQRHQQRKRPSWQEWRRGNATWHHQMKSNFPVAIETGRAFTLRATVSVLRDLSSVQRFIAVEPA
jgi:hypothetical protein